MPFSSAYYEHMFDSIYALHGTVSLRIQRISITNDNASEYIKESHTVANTTTKSGIRMKIGIVYPEPELTAF